MTHRLPLDPRLTDFDWDARRAAPVGRLIDTHAHFYHDEEKLAGLFQVMEKYNTECVFLISELNASGDWLKIVEQYGEIGKNVIPFYWIDMTQNDPACVKRAHDMGFWGIKAIFPNHSYDDHFYDPIYDAAQTLGMPMLFHTGLLGKKPADPQTGTGMSLMRPGTLDTIASRFPGLLIQGAHLGSPFIAEAVLSSMYSPNLMWDTCGGCRFLIQVDPNLLAAPLNGRAQLWDRLMWGTDTVSGVFPPEYADGWPTQYEYQLAFWQEIFSRYTPPPTSEQLDGFFYKNAARRIAEIKAIRQA